MSLSFVSLGALGDTNARSTYTCSVQRSPGANTLVLVGVIGTATLGTVVPPSAISGCGMEFSLVTSDTSFGGTQGNETHVISLWRSMAASPVSSLISVNFSISMTGCAVLVTEVSGVSTSGTSGAKAATQSAISNDQAGSDSAITIRGPSAVSTANGWFSIGGIVAAGLAEAPQQNWIQLDEVGYSTPSVGLASGYTLLSTGTTAVWLGGGAQRRGGVIVEIVLDNPVVITPSLVTLPVQGRRFRIPPVPGEFANTPVGRYLQIVAAQLNNEGFISLFSGTDPNLSNFTGIPGSLALNIGSASTATRLWGMQGSVASLSTTSWRPFRMA